MQIKSEKKYRKLAFLLLKHAKIKKNEDFLHFFAKIFCHMKNL